MSGRLCEVALFVFAGLQLGNVLQSAAHGSLWATIVTGAGFGLNAFFVADIFRARS
jgi:hypothetical protein